MKIGGIGNLCLWCMEEMGESSCCPYCGHDERIPQRAEQTIPAGQIIGGHYLIGRTLGQGGFGITYLAYDLDLHIKRAIKEYFPQGLVMRVGNSVRVTRQSVQDVYQKGVDSFYREAQSIARFGGHPNVVQVHAFFRENDSAYFVMDYVEGISFKQYLEDRGGRVSWEEALRILKPIGEALTALHESHLLHRDVKPDNIYITRNGTPKLLDFGAARYETSETTHSSASVLTPGYAPVEQYGSMSRQGTFTDVYALSATFYRAVSGVVPISAPDRMMEDPLLPLNKVDGRVPASIGAALSHGMGVRSEKRTQSVAELLKELESPSSRKSASKLPKWLLPAVAVLVLGLVLGMGLRKPGAVEKQTEPAAETVDIAGTAEALALTKVKESEIPTDTPEPTADKTREFMSLWETGMAETEAVWNMRSETEAARPTETPKPTVTAIPTATKVPTATRTPKPTATHTPEPTADKTLEYIAVQKTAFAETEVAWNVRLETEAARPTETPKPTATAIPTATMAPMATPTPKPTATHTPEPTADKTFEYIAVQKTAFAETEVAWNVRLETEAARPTETPKPTATTHPTATKVPTATRTPKPTATHTSEPTSTAVPIQSVITDEIRNAQAGDHIYYGHYEQDNDLNNGAEAIEWRVLAREGNRLLLLSEYGLNEQRYNQEKVDITWENCTLRKWLNWQFYKSAFNAEEQAQIAITEVKAEDNPEYGTEAGNDTQDKIFLLSIQDVNTYFKNNEELQCKATAYAIANGVHELSSGTISWWLRSPGEDSKSASIIFGEYGVDNDYTVFFDSSVRPAFWLNLDAEISEPAAVQGQEQSVITDEIRNALAGDHIYYGHYDQNLVDMSNGEAIEWRVLAREENRLLLLSEYGLDTKMYNDKFEDITWENCTLRSWLNGEFYESAFSAEEQEFIAETDVKAEDNPSYGTEAGNDTKDRIFLLSVQEANTYFKNDEDRQCKVTAYAHLNNAASLDKYGGTGWWWLRSPGNTSAGHNAACVFPQGSVRDDGCHSAYYETVVRPALWLNLDAYGGMEAEISEPVETQTAEQDKITDDIQVKRDVPQYFIAGAGCFWYRKPDASSDQLGYLQGGTEIQLTGENKSAGGKQWIKIKSANDLEGWIDTDNYEMAYMWKKESINVSEVQPGDYLYYGHYEQDNDRSNGEEAIEWRVLAREEDRLLLISEYGLDAKAYNEERGTITWEECTLRSWLNGAFYESAFSAEEKKQIAETEVKAEKNPDYDTNPGNDTKDRIFLLSIQEANTYFEDNEDRECKVTAYADAQGAYIYEKLGTGWWWLRSPGDGSSSAAGVGPFGSVDYDGTDVSSNSAVVRPALWLNL